MRRSASFSKFNSSILKYTWSWFPFYQNFMTLLTWYSQLVQCTVIYELTKKRKEVGDCRKKKKKQKLSTSWVLLNTLLFAILINTVSLTASVIRPSGFCAWENSITEIDEMLVILDPLSVCLSHYADYTARVSCK